MAAPNASASCGPASVRELAIEAAGHERARDSHREPGSGGDKGLANHHHANVVGRGPKGDAQADFRDAPHDAEVQDRIQADEHQQRRQTRKVKGTQAHHAFAKQRGVPRVLQGMDLDEIVSSKGDNRAPRQRLNRALGGSGDFSNTKGRTEVRVDVEAPAAAP